MRSSQIGICGGWAMAAAGAASVLAGVARAQDLTHKAPAQSEAIAIVSATLHPVSGPAIEGGFVVFEKGTISQIGSGKLETGPDTRVIDGRGLHVYPGLISASTQLGLVEFGLVRQSRDYDEAGDTSPEVRAIAAVNPDSTLFPVTRSAGVLIAGVFPSGGVVSGQPGVIRLDGWTWEEMAVEQSVGLRVNWPNARPSTSPFVTTGRDEQVAAIRRNTDAIDQLFKSAIAYRSARATDAATSADVRYDAMLGVLPPSDQKPEVSFSGRQRSVFIQASDADQITQAVTWAVGLGLRPVIVGGRDAPECAELLKKYKVPVVLNGTYGFPRRDDAGYDDAYSLPARVDAAGVAWCLTAGGEPPNERWLAHQAGMAVRHGLSTDAALRSITLSAAETLGIADRYGSLEKGKSATLLVTDGDVLEVMTNVKRAFIDGREIDLTNKQTKLRDKYRERYKQMGLIKGE